MALDETPQEFFRWGSVMAASPGMSETRSVWTNAVAKAVLAVNPNRPSPTKAARRTPCKCLILVPSASNFPRTEHFSNERRESGRIL